MAIALPAGSAPLPFRETLRGANAFYDQPNDGASTQSELIGDKRVPVTYTWNTEYKIITLAKWIFSVLIFPIGIYYLLHSLASIPILPAAWPKLCNYPENFANQTRSEIDLKGEWRYKRVTVAVDGYEIDAMIVGKPSTLNNRRWVLVSVGNGEFYEKTLGDPNFKDMLTELQGNALVFNYPGVGSSSGLPNRQAMAKAYRAMLSFLEDQEKGIGAHEVIGYGFSIGAGVQGDALKTHTLKEGVKYVFVKDQTFSDLSQAALGITGLPFLSFLVKLLGWNIDPVTSSRTLKAPEIILQTARDHDYKEIRDSSAIQHDGVITADASLAKALLDDRPSPESNKPPESNKLFIGLTGGHGTGLSNPSYLAGRINAILTAEQSF